MTLKSSVIALENRGYLPDNAESEYFSLNISQRIQLLLSETPSKRTLGARLLCNLKENVVESLIEALKKEKKLYTKIEICNALVSNGKHSILPLINQLGEIGNNQHKTIPTEGFSKDNYPLPRDIAARTLAFIGSDALPELINSIQSATLKKTSEAIDAIGYICFYNSDRKYYEILLNLYSKTADNTLIQWKIVRAMSAFQNSIGFLEHERENCPHPALKQEIERSLRIIKKRIALFK